MRVARAYLRKRLENAVVATRIVQLVRAIVGEEELEGAAKEFIAVAGVQRIEIAGIAKRAPNQHRCTITDVAGDQCIGQRWFVDIRERCIHRVAEVERRINERAVEIKDEEAGRSTDHGC